MLKKILLGCDFGKRLFFYQPLPEELHSCKQFYRKVKQIALYSLNMNVAKRSQNIITSG
jgi:hypothetical protein